MKRTIPVFALVILAVIPIVALQVTKPGLPPPFHTPSADNRPQIISRPDGAQLQLPTGFNIEVYAEGFERPRFMLGGPNGEILLSETTNNGSVSLLVDKDHDFKADSREKLVSSLDRPYGLALWKNYLYVAEATSLKRYKYDSKAMSVAMPGEEVVSMKDFGKGHSTRTLLFDRKGEKIYLTIGSSANVVTGDDPRRAAINRYNPDGTGHEIVASGLRNTLGLRFYPGTDVLWAAVQERDGLGDDLVPDFFTQVRQGAFYGWPYAYLGRNEEPSLAGQRRDLVDKTVVPDVLLTSHIAVMDAVFYSANQFPREYRGGAFLANHGSSNRSKRVGYSVTFIPFKDGKPSGPPRDFLTGFMLDPDSKQVWGRPVGLLQMKDGSLLLSDDGGKRIWRISYKKM